MPGPEIVEREAGAKIPEPLQDLSRLFGIFHQGRFGKLKLERAARQAAASKYGAQAFDDVILEQLPRRYAHAGEQRHATARRALPQRELARGAFNGEQPEIRDKADFLDHRNKFEWRKAAHFRMVPARQRLKSVDRPL